MSIDQFKYCFRRNVSFKRRREHRGHKGVGASFLAYGFSLVRLQSKRDGMEIAGQLRQGREWADDAGTFVNRPKFERLDFDVPELKNEPSGTSIEILIGNRRPQLPWLQATKAQQWLDVLRIKTPLGGLYLSAPDRKLRLLADVTVRQSDGTIDRAQVQTLTITILTKCPYWTRLKTVDAIEKQINSMKGDPDQRLVRLPDEYKRLDAIWQVWDKNTLLKDATLTRNLDDEQKELIEKHQISAYGCFVSTAKIVDRVQRANIEGSCEFRSA